MGFRFRTPFRRRRSPRKRSREIEPMPAEQALTEARKKNGPSYGPGGGGHLAFRRRLEESAAFLGPIALIGALAMTGGGFSVSSRHIAGLIVWLIVVGLLVLGVA